MSTATLAEPAVSPAVVSSAEPMETDEAFYETVHGQRVEMPPMSIRAAMIASRIGIALNAFARPKGLGEAFTELLVHIPLPEDKTSRPTSRCCVFRLSPIAFDPYRTSGRECVGCHSRFGSRGHEPIRSCRGSTRKGARVFPGWCAIRLGGLSQPSAYRRLRNANNNSCRRPGGNAHRRSDPTWISTGARRPVRAVRAAEYMN